MNGIVIQLQEEALNDSVDIETLLRKAYLVARKLKLDVFMEWIENEQNGYSEEIPDYRIVNGEIDAYNPNHGWQPVVIQGEGLDSLKTRRIGNPISVIAESYENSDGSIYLSIESDLTEFINNNVGGIPTNYRLRLSKTYFHQIISSVRNSILRWSLLLEENGITGDGVSFSDEEKQKAIESKVINNYTNNIYSSSENINIEQGSRNYQDVDREVGGN